MKIVTGDNKLQPILANKRGTNIGDKIIKNKELCNDTRLTDLQILFSTETRQQNQRCNARGCKSCRLFVDNPTSVEAGGYSHIIPSTVTCKSRNVIYLAQCQKCKSSQGSYVGQTQQPLHIRMNNHRSTFYNHPENSALAYHSTKKHEGRLTLEDFTLSILCQTNPCDLNKLENFYIMKFRCRTLGLNRCDIVAH